MNCKESKQDIEIRFFRYVRTSFFLKFMNWKFFLKIVILKWPQLCQSKKITPDFLAGFLRLWWTKVKKKRYFYYIIVISFAMRGQEFLEKSWNSQNCGKKSFLTTFFKLKRAVKTGNLFSKRNSCPRLATPLLNN